MVFLQRAHANPCLMPSHPCAATSSSVSPMVGPTVDFALSDSCAGHMAPPRRLTVMALCRQRFARLWCCSAGKRSRCEARRRAHRNARDHRLASIHRGSQRAMDPIGQCRERPHIASLALDTGPTVAEAHATNAEPGAGRVPIACAAALNHRSNIACVARRTVGNATACALTQPRPPCSCRRVGHGGRCGARGRRHGGHLLIRPRHRADAIRDGAPRRARRRSIWPPTLCGPYAQAAPARLPMHAARCGRGEDHARRMRRSSFIAPCIATDALSTPQHTERARIASARLAAHRDEPIAAPHDGNHGTGKARRRYVLKSSLLCRRSSYAARIACECHV